MLQITPRNETAHPSTDLSKAHIPSTSLQILAERSAHILAEVAATARNPALMFSGGKDSACIAHVACRLFGRGQIPVSLVHYDSGDNFPEVLQYRDQLAKDFGVNLLTLSVPEYAALGKISPATSEQGSIAALIQLINLSVREFDFDALIGGGRRDEERARAKERIFSIRDAAGRWNPRNQRPEPWEAFNTETSPGEHLRVFPLSDWTERNVWEYIAKEHVPLPGLYYAHNREVFERNGVIQAYYPGVALRTGESVSVQRVRCRTVGDRATTGFILSEANTAQDVLHELKLSRFSERAARVDDAAPGTGMEARKRLGWP